MKSPRTPDDRPPEISPQISKNTVYALATIAAAIAALAAYATCTKENDTTQTQQNTIDSTNSAIKNNRIDSAPSTTFNQ